jgi:hypothetical protein
MAGSGRHNADERLIAELAAGATVKCAACAAGISERTAYRRLDDVDFVWRVRKARFDLLFLAVGKLADASAEAAETLRASLKSDNEALRVRAAAAILDRADGMWATAEVEERVKALEVALRGDLAWIDSHDASNGWRR